MGILPSSKRKQVYWQATLRCPSRGGADADHRHVPARRSDAGAAAYAEDKVDAGGAKYLRRPVDAHVILAVSKQRHVAEITLQADHVSMFAKETTHDLYSAIDLAVEKLEHQAQKLKARRSEHKGVGAPRAARRRTTAPRPRAAAAAGHRDAPRVGQADVASTTRSAGSSAPTDEFLVFTNAADQRLAVLYRRKDGRFGLIAGRRALERSS